MPTVGEGFNIAVTGSTHDEFGLRFTADPHVHRRLVERLNNKMQNNADEITDVESYNVENCEIGVVSFGCTSRAVYEAVKPKESKRAM